MVESSVLPDGAKVGDVYKVEATIALDGIEIHSVVPGRTGRKEPERLEILGGGEFQAVTTSLVGRRDGGDRSRGDRRDPGDRKDRGERRPGDRGDRRDRPPGDRRPSDRRPSHPSGERASDGADRARPVRAGGRRRPLASPAASDRDRPTYAPVPEVPQRPKPKRLKPGREHRQALMETLPDEHRPIADQLFRGGLPSVRQALKDQNVALAAEGKPEIKTTGIESLAQDLLPRVRVAEWLDRADAARATIDDLDLRDLRSVVTAAADPTVARDDTTRELAAELREALEHRQNEEHEQWLADITAALDVGRVVRALRLSSRPPKAGVRFPPELGARLAEATTASLTADAASDRWVAVVEALAFAPVHAVVTPAAPPTAVSDDLRAMVKGMAPAVPQIATLLGIEVPPPGTRVVQATEERFGRVDVLVADTGGPPTGTTTPFARGLGPGDCAAPAQHRRLATAALPGMKERGWGRVLAVTSVAVKQPVDNLILSNSLRAAVTGYAKTLAREVAQDGITVNTILPGYTATERVTELNQANAEREGVGVEEVQARLEASIPMGRLAEPEEFAALAVFLASERAGYITGGSFAVDGGWLRGLL